MDIKIDVFVAWVVFTTQWSTRNRKIYLKYLHTKVC